MKIFCIGCWCIRCKSDDFGISPDKSYKIKVMDKDALKFINLKDCLTLTCVLTNAKKYDNLT